MSNSIEPNVIASFAVAETTLTVAETPTDAELIAAAKDLNTSVLFHLRKSVEEFWKLGETLTRLHERPSMEGRWRRVLKEIGINHQSANQAERLHAAISLEGLAKYRNKTHALRDLGILAQPSPAKEREASDRSTKPAPKPARTDAPAEGYVAEPGIAAAMQPEVPGKGPEAASHSGHTGALVGKDLAVEVAGGSPPEPPVAGSPSPLDTIAEITALLDGLGRDEFDPTPEFVAHLDRAAVAIDLLRRKANLRHAA